MDPRKPDQMEHSTDLYPHDRLSHRWCQVCADFERDGTKPAWIRRMQAQGLPSKDMTGLVIL